MRDSNALLATALVTWFAIPSLCTLVRRRRRTLPRVLGGAAVLLTILASGVLASRYSDFQNEVGRRYVAGYQVHHRVDTAYDELPVQVTTFSTDHWYTTAAIWLLFVLAGSLLLAAPIVTAVTFFKSPA